MTLHGEFAAKRRSRSDREENGFFDVEEGRTKSWREPWLNVYVWTVKKERMKVS